VGRWRVAAGQHVAAGAGTAGLTAAGGWVDVCVLGAGVEVLGAACGVEEPRLEPDIDDGPPEPEPLEVDVPASGSVYWLSPADGPLPASASAGTSSTANASARAIATGILTGRRIGPKASRRSARAD
jgi:hypothetical protein